MKGKFKLHYDTNPYAQDGNCYGAAIITKNDDMIYAWGKSFEEAKAKAIDLVRSLPENEEVEIN